MFNHPEKGNKEHKRCQNDVARFLANGGKINKVGVTKGKASKGTINKKTGDK